eukprot:3202661-Rhodomonas_salina.1
MTSTLTFSLSLFPLPIFPSHPGLFFLSPFIPSFFSPSIRFFLFLSSFSLFPADSRAGDGGRDRYTFPLCSYARPTRSPVLMCCAVVMLLRAPYTIPSTDALSIGYAPTRALRDPLY